MSDVCFHSLMFALCVAVGGGCKSTTPSGEESLPTSRPAPLTMEEHTIPLAQSSVAVTQGPAPLVYIFNSAASIRVVDLTTGQQLAAGSVAPRSLVRVDDLHGVTIGSENVAPGRLTPGHQYVIYSDPTTPNTISHGVGRPIDVPKTNRGR